MGKYFPAIAGNVPNYCTEYYQACKCFYHSVGKSKRNSHTANNLPLLSAQQIYPHERVYELKILLERLPRLFCTEKSRPTILGFKHFERRSILLTDIAHRPQRKPRTSQTSCVYLALSQRQNPQSICLFFGQLFGCSPSLNIYTKQCTIITTNLFSFFKFFFSRGLI